MMEFKVGWLFLAIIKSWMTIGASCFFFYFFIKATNKFNDWDWMSFAIAGMMLVLVGFCVYLSYIQVWLELR